MKGKVAEGNVVASIRLVTSANSAVIVIMMYDGELSDSTQNHSRSVSVTLLLYWIDDWFSTSFFYFLSHFLTLGGTSHETV